MVSWRAQRLRELWAAAIGPTSLLIGIWGLVFRADMVVAVGLIGVLAASLLQAANWAGRAISLGLFVALAWGGSFLPSEIGLSDAGLAALSKSWLSAGCHTYSGISATVID